MQTLTKPKKSVRFNTTESLLSKLKAKRPDLLEAALQQPLRIVIAKNVLRLRGEAGLTRELLSERTGEVGARTIQRIEEGGEDSNPTVRVLEALAKALGTTAVALADPSSTIMGIKWQ